MAAKRRRNGNITLVHRSTFDLNLSLPFRIPVIPNPTRSPRRIDCPVVRKPSLSVPKRGIRYFCCDPRRTSSALTDKTEQRSRPHSGSNLRRFFQPMTEPADTLLDCDPAHRRCTQLEALSASLHQSPENFSVVFCFVVEIPALDCCRSPVRVLR